MIALKTEDLRNDFKRVSNLITSGERVLISRPRNENLVVLSERDFNELERARHNAEYIAMLEESIKEYEDGRVVVKTIEELEDMT